MLLLPAAILVGHFESIFVSETRLRLRLFKLLLLLLLTRQRCEVLDSLSAASLLLVLMVLVV